MGKSVAALMGLKKLCFVLFLLKDLPLEKNKIEYATWLPVTFTLPISLKHIHCKIFRKCFT